MWLWCRMTLPARRLTLNHIKLRSCQPRLWELAGAGRVEPYSRVSGNNLCGRLDGCWLSNFIQ